MITVSPSIIQGIQGGLGAILGPLWPAYVVLRLFFILIDIFLVAILAIALIKMWKFRPNFDVEPRAQAKVATLRTSVFRERWGKILKKISASTPYSLPLAVIEADALVDDALRHLGLLGEHMADRLSRLSPDDVKTLDRVWRAHRIRNDVVHTPGFYLSPGDGKQALADYEAFLKELEII